MNNTFSAFTATPVVTSGTGVIGLTGKPLYLQGIYNSNASAQAVTFYSGSAAATMCMATLPSRLYTSFPMAGPGGITYQTLGNPGDAALGLVFFWVPGINT